MTARKSEPRLYAKPFDASILTRQPEKKEPKVRSFHDFLGADGAVEWTEVSTGERGKSVARVCLRGLEQRDMNLGNFTEGGALETSRQPRAVDVISYLRAKTLGRRLGVNYPEVTAADFGSPFPKVAMGAGLTFVGDGGAPAQAALAFGAIAPGLRTGIAWCDLSYNIWRTTGGVAEEITTRDLFDAAAAGVDRVLFGGDSLLEPCGVVNVPTVSIIDGGTFTIAKAAGMLKTAEDGNAETIAWAMAPDVAELLRQRPKVSGGERMIFEGNEILGFPAFVSNSVPSGTLIGGDFTKATVMLRDIDLLADRSS